MNRMLSIAYPTPNQVVAFMLGVTTMTLLWAGTAYTSPVARCVNERATVYVSAPVSKCYPISAWMPESALERAR